MEAPSSQPSLYYVEYYADLILVGFVILFILYLIYGCLRIEPDLPTQNNNVDHVQVVVEVARPRQTNVDVVAAPVVRFEKRIVLYTKSKNEMSNRKEECVICLEEFEQGCQCCQLVQCKHIYHLHCIDTWLNVNKHCPLCRQSVHNRTYASDLNIV
ncbi:hypothetical protein ACFE04_022789 [Oxalis oulophora]